MLDGDCRMFVERLFDSSVNELASEILVCLFWRLVEAFVTAAPDAVSFVADPFDL